MATCFLRKVEDEIKCLNGQTTLHKEPDIYRICIYTKSRLIIGVHKALLLPITTASDLLLTKYRSGHLLLLYPSMYYKLSGNLKPWAETDVTKLVLFYLPFNFRAAFAQWTDDTAANLQHVCWDGQQQ